MWYFVPAARLCPQPLVHNSRSCYLYRSANPNTTLFSLTRLYKDSDFRLWVALHDIMSHICKWLIRYHLSSEKCKKTNRGARSVWCKGAAYHAAAAVLGAGLMHGQHLSSEDLKGSFEIAGCGVSPQIRDDKSSTNFTSQGCTKLPTVLCGEILYQTHLTAFTLNELGWKIL